MKKITFLSLLLAAGLSINAQTTETQSVGNNSSFVEVFGGFSMPMGNWSKSAYNKDDVGGWIPTDAANISAGFAGNGATFGYEGAWFFSKYIGFGGVISYSSFAIPIKFADSLSQGYKASFDVDRTTTTVSGAYTMLSVLPGVYFRYPFSDKFSANVKLLCGFTSATTPNISVDVEDGGVDDGSFVQLASVANSLAFMGGLNLSYNLCSNFAINLQGNYFYSKPDFFIANLNRPVQVGREIFEYNQPLSYMNFSLGLAYTFGKK